MLAGRVTARHEAKNWRKQEKPHGGDGDDVDDATIWTFQEHLGRWLTQSVIKFRISWLHVVGNKPHTGLLGATGYFSIIHLETLQCKLTEELFRWGADGQGDATPWVSLHLEQLFPTEERRHHWWEGFEGTMERVHNKIVITCEIYQRTIFLQPERTLILRQRLTKD